VIVSKLMGGLGNQMFQYSLGRRLAQDRGVPLKLDVSWYQDRVAGDADTLREYALDGWHIRAAKASAEDLAQFSIGKRLLGRLGLVNIAVLREQELGFEPSVLDAPHTAYLTGYWQSEKYFKPMRSVLLQEFTLVSAPCAHAAGLEHRVRESDSVAVHVRRGDYARNRKTNAYHGLCPAEYYIEAARRIANRLAKPSFFVFSDDLDWVRQNLKLDWPTTYVVHDKECSPHQDIWLMSRCAHHIIANSSFSWWGAWLSPNENKVVIAPSQWFAHAQYSANDLIPESWLRI